MSIKDYEEKIYQRKNYFDVIANYKISIFLITLLFMLATILYIFSTQKIYKTDAAIEIVPYSNLLDPNENSLVQRREDYIRHIDTQIDLLKSRSLISKVIDKVEDNVRYYKEDSFLMMKDLYKDSPVKVNNIKIKNNLFYDRNLEVKVLDSKRFQLKLLSKSKINRFMQKAGIDFFQDELKYEAIHTFSKPVNGRFFDLMIEKTDTLKNNTTIFRINSKNKLIKNISSNLNIISKSANSNIIEIIYKDSSPLRAENFVNSLLDEYLKINVDKNTLQTVKTLKFIENQLQREKVQLDKSEKDLQKYVEKNKVAGIDDQTQNVVDAIYQYESQLEDVSTKKRKIDSVYKQFVKTNDYKSILAEISNLNNNDLISIIGILQEKENQYNELRLKYKDKHPDLIKIKNSINDNLQILETNLKQMQKSTQREVRNVRSIVSRHKRNLSNIPQKEIGYAKLKRDHDFIEKRYLYLLDKKSQLSITKTLAETYEYKIVDKAFVPENPVKPKPVILLALGTILGFITGLIYALMREYFDKNIKTQEDIERITNLPYFGTIPYIKDKRLYNKLYVTKNPNSIASQMIWSIRAGIDFFGRDKRCKIVAVTSMVKGEGKTTTAANLASTLGMGSKKTIILTLDLRLPELHNKFNLDNELGISSVFSRKAKLRDVVQSIEEIPNLDVITSGPIPPNPIELIGSDDVNKILSSLEDVYDYIIIDLPPIGAAAEPIMFMKKADVIICVLKANYSEKSFVTNINKMAHRYSIENIGFVLNGVDEKAIEMLNKNENIKYFNYNQKENLRLNNEIY